MQTHKINEMCELLTNAWLEQPNSSLMAIIAHYASQAKHNGDLALLSDDVLFYQLKMRHSKQADMIPGIEKDCEQDFKAAILKARGL